MLPKSLRGGALLIACVSLGTLEIACAGAANPAPAPVVEIPLATASATPTTAPIAEVIVDAGAQTPQSEGDMREAADFGMIGILSTSDGGTGGAIGSPFGSGSGFGQGGIGLGGTTINRHTPKITQGVLTATGPLPPEVIQRMVRASFGKFRLCYERGLGKNPKLAGRVVVKFAIGMDGSVTSSSDGGSDIADKDVTTCVVRAFMAIGFPAPDGGAVAVSYPIRFAPRDDDTRKQP